jgi:hypothetical protein
MVHGLRGREKSTAYLRGVLRVQWRPAFGAELAQWSRTAALIFLTTIQQ